MDGTFTTNVMWHDSQGNEREAEVRVTYVGRHGFPQTLENPAEPATVEITAVEPIELGTDVPAVFIGNGELEALCFEHWRDTCEAAKERRAEDHREMLRLGL